MKHDLELYAGPCCFSRPTAIAEGRRISRRFSDLHFRIHDMIAEDRLASGEAIRFSPTWVLDGRIIWVGMPSARELLRIVRRKLESKE